MQGRCRDDDRVWLFEEGRRKKRAFVRLSNHFFVFSISLSLSPFLFSFLEQPLFLEMSPPKATPDLKQRGIASFFGGGGGGAAAKKTPGAATTTATPAMAKLSTEAAAADAAATVVEEPSAAAASSKRGDDVDMVDSLDSDVKREVRRRRREIEKRERLIRPMRTLRFKKKTHHFSKSKKNRPRPRPR